MLVAFSSSRAKEYLKELGIPEGYKPYASVALGYKNTKSIKASPRKPNVINYITLKFKSTLN